MGLINYYPLTDGTGIDANDVNTPFQDIYNEFNGNISDANIAASSISGSKLADSSVAFAKLASTIFSGQVTSYTNTGSGGGTGYYINLGGLKLCWGLSGTITGGSGSYTTSLPASFFTTIQYAMTDMNNASYFANKYTNAITTSQITTYLSSSGGGSNTKLMWFVIGT